MTETQSLRCQYPGDPAFAFPEVGLLHAVDKRM
jgi:hypothetical protein